MTADDFTRFNSLSEKAMSETASRNECVEFNLLNGLRDL